MEAIRVMENWQKAGVFYVRVAAMVKEFGYSMELEFNDADGVEAKYILVMERGFPVGTCRIREVEDDIAKIERVCVLNEYRGKGVGHLAIRAAEEWAIEEGVKKIIINARDEVVGFYESMGYVTDWSRTFGGEIDPASGKKRFITVNTEKIL